MKKFVMLGLTLAVLAGPGFSATAASQTAKEKKIARLERKLNSLPNAASPPAPVTHYTRQLIKLEPRNSKRWYKLATLKYISTFVERKATYMANIARRLVGQSNLGAQMKTRIQRQITKIENRVVQFNEPTPAPYQARVSPRPLPVAI